MTEPARDWACFGVRLFALPNPLPPSLFTFGDVLGFRGSPFGDCLGSMCRSSDPASDRFCVGVRLLGSRRP
jgi:hypothetical protein